MFGGCFVRGSHRWGLLPPIHWIAPGNLVSDSLSLCGSFQKARGGRNALRWQVPPAHCDTVSASTHSTSEAMEGKGRSTYLAEANQKQRGQVHPAPSGANDVIAHQDRKSILQTFQGDQGDPTRSPRIAEAPAYHQRFRAVRGLNVTKHLQSTSMFSTLRTKTPDSAPTEELGQCPDASVFLSLRFRPHNVTASR